LEVVTRHPTERNEMYAVIINEGPLTAEDNALYYSKEKPVGLLIDFESKEGDMVKFGRFLSFVPTNGPRAGTEMLVPVERVVSISENT